MLANRQIVMCTAAGRRAINIGEDAADLPALDADSVAAGNGHAACARIVRDGGRPVATPVDSDPGYRAAMGSPTEKAHSAYVDLFRALGGSVDRTDIDEIIREVQRRLGAFMLEYEFGLQEVLTKVTILRREFQHAHTYGPIEHVATRVKSIDSLLQKMERLACPPDLAVIRETIRDIAGVRITCVFADDAYQFADILTRQPDLRVLARKDYIADPKPNGYRSLHLIVEVPVFLSHRTEHIPVEIQIRTIAMDFWASVEHQIRYKYSGRVPGHLESTLGQVAEVAHELDSQMGRLRQEVRDLATPSER